MTVTVLLTGFGPFPGVPLNPTQDLVNRLARIRRPALTGVQRIAHVFSTSYVAVDHDLPRLMRRYRPDALLMFGLASRSRRVRIEMRARNSASLLHVDVARSRASVPRITALGPSSLPLRAPAKALLAGARSRRVPAMLSHDAGRYICNYSYWRGLEAATKPQGPSIVAFVHVPKLRRTWTPHRGRKYRPPAFEDLLHAAEHMLVTTIAAVRSKNMGRAPG